MCENIYAEPNHHVAHLLNNKHDRGWSWA